MTNPSEPSPPFSASRLLRSKAAGKVWSAVESRPKIDVHFLPVGRWTNELYQQVVDAVAIDVARGAD